MTVLRLTSCYTHNTLALVKFGCMLERLSIPRYSPIKQMGSDNALGADNQQETAKEVVLI
jgi:hypothetical protein